MSTQKTFIQWQLHNYCTRGCSYCPSKFWGGPEPRHVQEYIAVTKKLIDHYSSLGRTINWFFTGGDPLEFFDFPEMLKLCKESGGNITLYSAGGKMWMDWWAIEPHIDTLHLTYHYWQNPSLIKFIIQTFQKKEKQFTIKVPIRPDHFDEDFNRAESIKDEFGIYVEKSVLFKEAEPMLGFYDYTADQLARMHGKEWVEKYFLKTNDKTFEQQFEQSIKENPSYTGRLCNTGIERLLIGAEGWARGSDCNSANYGNIFDPKFTLPTGPEPCKMLSCISEQDQRITKFPAQ